MHPTILIALRAVSVSMAVWMPEVRRARVLRPRGKLILKMGQKNCLDLLETLYLAERHDLALFGDPEMKRTCLWKAS